jgi:hypothetical protein
VGGEDSETKCKRKLADRRMLRMLENKRGVDRQTKEIKKKK